MTGNMILWEKETVWFYTCCHLHSIRKASTSSSSVTSIWYKNHLDLVLDEDKNSFQVKEEVSIAHYTDNEV